MNVFIGYIIVYISIIFGSIYISDKFNKKIENCIIIDILVKMIGLYILGLLNQLKIGVIILNILSILLGIITIIKRRKNTVKLKENILTYGMLFFTIIYFSFIIFTYNKMSNIWDEYSYWSTISKKIFYSNKLINEGMLFVYPPFPTLLQYFFTKTIGIYSQGIEIFANIILGFSLLIPLFERIKTNRKLPNICLGITIICIPAIFHYIYFYQAIYLDIIIGLLIAYILYQIYNEENEAFLITSLILDFIVLSLTKAVGFYIAMILIGVIILKNIIVAIIEKKDKKTTIIQNIKNNKKSIMVIIVITLIILISYITWSIYIKDFQPYKDTIEKQHQEIADGQLSIIDAIKTIKTTMFGSSNESVDYDTSNRTLFHALYEKYAITKPINLSILSFTILYVIASIVIYKFYTKKEDKAKYVSTIISVIVGLFVYTLFIQLSYLTQFGINETLKHSSIERYINTYLLAMFILLISIIIAKLEENNKNINFKYSIFILAILLITPLNIITDATIASGNINAITRYQLSEIEEESKVLKEKINKNNQIYLINQSSDKLATSWKLKYFLIPEIDIKTTIKFDEKLEKEFENENLLNKWKQILYNDYDYVYIFVTDEYFNNFAKVLFKNNEIKEKTIYKIEKENNDIILVEFK